ncbi:uncharacterized protein [Euwallacea similis]|uniref:uncharacterized protein n=1 Tax=Euwallacea similis TaxID=1736056 RepID=UPI00344C484D
MDVDIKSRISSWISSSFLDNGYESVDTEIVGSSEKGDGYLGDIAFLKVKCLRKHGSAEKLDLVVKYGKMSKILREKLPVQVAFKREVFVYGTLIPLFRRFEEEKNLKILDNFLVKCFNTLLTENEEVLVLQNTKAIGYELHDRFQPLNLNHLKLTFENYGRWHALGIAYKDQYPEEFRKHFSDMECVIKAFFPPMRNVVDSTEQMVYSVLDEQGELNLKKRFKEALKGNMFDSIMESVSRPEENCVITHGDCWNNNFMFKYTDHFKTNPQKVVFLDFQVSNAGSPVLDLSYHLYATASEAELQQFDTLLRIYHNSLSSTIKQLGSDPDKLFPYEELVKQWKKYSLYGCLFSMIVLPIALSEKDDSLDIQNWDEKEINNMFDQVKKKNFTQLASRMISVIKHFLDDAQWADSMDDTLQKRTISKWILDVFGLEKVDFEIVGSTEKGDGYTGDIVFVEIKGKEQYSVVVKSGKSSKEIREKLQVKHAYEREIFLYSVLVPKFKKLEKNLKIQEKFLVKCFGTRMYDHQEVLFLENLKAQGYELHSKFESLNLNHLRLNFENYGRWHALSIAYKHKHPEDFKKLFENKPCVLTIFLPFIHSVAVGGENLNKHILETEGRTDAIKLLKERLPEGYYESLKNICGVVEEYSVVVHGDCWNNNYMYKYKDQNKTDPEAVKFLDFQCLKLAPPVFDLSAHLYCTASEEGLKSLKFLLQVYYSSLADTLKQLDCDASKLFPYEELVRQWKLYSKFGFLMSTIALAMTLTEKEDVIDIENISEAETKKMIEIVLKKNKGILSSRTLAVVNHWLFFDDFYKSMNMNNRSDDIKRWISDVFQGFKSVDFTVIGTTDVGDGYLGDVTFLEVTGDGKRFDIVFKHSKQNPALQEFKPMRLWYKREVFVYSKVLPTFQKLEQDHNVNLVGELLPKCFKTLLYEKEDVVVLQNLRAQGYKNHDKCQPLDYDHFKITFKGYGQWHAFSLALRKNQPETFSRLFSNIECLHRIFLDSMKNSTTNIENILYEILSSKGDTEIVLRLQKHFPQGYKQKLLEIYEAQDTEKCVVLHHGDSWNNNFMFKYEGEKPTAVKILDFQCSGLNAPVLDLSYHLYTNGSEKEFNHTKEFLHIYYSSLSSTLKSLGCDAEELLPYQELIEQWKKYSIYGIGKAAMILPLTLTAKEDTFDVASINEGFKEMIEKLVRKNHSRLFPRLTAAVKHFLDFNDF